MLKGTPTTARNSWSKTGASTNNSISTPTMGNYLSMSGSSSCRRNTTTVLLFRPHWAISQRCSSPSLSTSSQNQLTSTTQSTSTLLQPTTSHLASWSWSNLNFCRKLFPIVGIQPSTSFWLLQYWWASKIQTILKYRRMLCWVCWNLRKKISYSLSKVRNKRNNST